jgi:hypothetical protein
MQGGYEKMRYRTTVYNIGKLPQHIPTFWYDKLNTYHFRVTIFTLFKNHHNFGSKCRIITIPTTYNFGGYSHMHLHGPSIAIGHQVHEILTSQQQTATQRSITFIVSSITPEGNIGSTCFEREKVARGTDYELHESNVLNGRIILELHRFSQRIIKQRYTAL